MKPFQGPGGSSVALKGLVLQIFWVFCWKKLSNSLCSGTDSLVSCKEISQGLRVAAPMLVEVIKQLIWKVGFSKEVTEAVTTGLRKSTACFYQGKRPRFLHCCCEQNTVPCKATVQQKAKFFLYLYMQLRLSLPAIKDYRAAPYM